MARESMSVNLMKVPVPVKKLEFRKHFAYDTEVASQETAYVECMDSLTVQSMSEDADINVMVRRFGITGQLPESIRIPSYGDFDMAGDYQSALNSLIEAQESFMSMPADLRARFDNNPQKFMEFCNPATDEQRVKNLTVLREYGMVKPVEAPPVVSRMVLVDSDNNPVVFPTVSDVPAK